MKYDEISPFEAAKANFSYLDVREYSELSNGTIKNSIHIPLGKLEEAIKLPDQNQDIVVYCQSGKRSKIACEILSKKGFSSVYSMKGGINAWISSCLDIEGNSLLSRQELQRYSRQITLKEIGFSGQEKLKRASVIIVGAGGLGSPLLQYLNSCGVGKLGIVDHDIVDTTNLHRQVLFGSNDVGRLKAEAASEGLKKQNPENVIINYNVKLSNELDTEFFSEYDLIIDGTDNFETKYLLNRIAHRFQKPFLTASLSAFAGQVAFFDSHNGPCYQCLFPEPPPEGAVPSCAEGGVLGAIPGVIGTIQSFEALKYILGLGDSLISSILTVDLMNFKFQKMRIFKDPDCEVCSKQKK